MAAEEALAITVEAAAASAAATVAAAAASEEATSADATAPRLLAISVTVERPGSQR
jgi:hypothetical protein